MVNFEILDKHINKLVEQGCFPSATLAVFHHNELIKNDAYGAPDPAHPWPARPDTQYDVASLSKLFAGTAFLKLCQAGVFDLDEPLSRRFPCSPASGRSASAPTPSCRISPTRSSATPTRAR